MKNALASMQTTFSNLPSTSDPPCSNASPSSGLPARQGRVIPIQSPEDDGPYINPYRDPSKVLERKQFIEFGCGACHFHQRKRDRSAFHCAVGISLWPDGTNKTCRSFMRRRKNIRPEEPK